MFDATGAEVWSASIDAYGALRNLKGDPQSCPFRFPGQYEDQETGLYYNRFRYYDPESGGYTQEDPIRLLGGLELRSYVGVPSESIDPLGLTGCVPNDPRLDEALADGRPLVIVGRGMNRVHPVADALRKLGHQVQTYLPKNFRSSPGNLVDADVEANRSWIRYWAKKKGALVIDIGEDPTRPGSIGPFYGAERSTLYGRSPVSSTNIVQHNPGF
jgi:RHS repeat-associated protein